MVGITDVQDDGDDDYTITEIESHVSRKVQIEEFEPFTVGETLTAEVEPGADIDEVSEELHDKAKENVQRDIVKRIEEKEMKEQLEGD